MPPRRNKRPPSWLEDYHVPAQKKGSRQRPQQQQASSSVPRRSVNVPVNIYGRFSDFLRDTTTETTIGNDRYLIPDVTEINNFSNNRDDVGNPTVDVVFVRNVNMVQQIRRSGRSRPFEIVATGAQRNITFNPVNTQGNNVTFTNGLQGRVQTANSDIARVQLPVSILDFNITPGGGTPVTAGTDAVVEYIAELAQNGLEYMRDVLLDMNTDYYFRITVYDANSNANMRLTVDRNFNTAYNLNYNSGTLPTDVSYPNRGLGRHDSRDRRYWTLIEATPRSALSNYRNPRGLIDYFERQSGTAAESLRNVSRGLSDVMRNYLRNYEEQGVSLNRIMIEALNPSDLTGNSGTPFTVIDYLNGRSVGGSSSGSSSSGVGWTGQKGNEVRIELHSKLIVVPETRTNCGYTSIAIGMMYERTPEILYDKKKQKSNGNKYKTKCGCSGEIKMNQEDATKISEKLGVTINMHFSDIHKPKWTVKSTKSNKQINLIVMNNHIGVIVDKHKVPPENLKKFKEELSITVEDSEFHKLASHLFTNDLYLEPIKDPSLKKPKDVFRNTKIAAFDIEAFEYDSFGNKIDQTPYLLGFGTFLSENPERSITDSVQYHVFEHTNSVVSFLRFLCDNYYVYDGYTIYAHNFAKYDSYVMFQNGLFEVPGLIVSDLITQNGGMIQMILKPSDDGKVKGIKFMDSARLIQGDLRSLLQEFKTPHQKLDLEHQKMTADTYMDNLEEAKTYLYNDVVGLLEMMEMFSISEWEESGINITNTITAASLSKKTFFYNFYPKCLQKGWNLYHLPEWLDSYIRRGYFGGRNECFKLGEFNTPIRYYDFTSLYPYVSTFPVPCGLPRVVTEESEVFDEDGKILDSFTGFVRCYVKGPAPDQRPLHALVHNNKLMFPRVISDGVEFLIFSEEIRFAQKLGLEYDYNFKDAVYFELQPILKEFMEFCFAQKAEQKKLGNDMKSKAYKIKVNSGYGVFGLKTKFRDSVKIMNYDPEDSKNIQKINKTLMFLVESGRFVGATDTGNHVVVRQAVDLKIKDFNVSVASAITSYARCKLYEFGHDYGWENHIYADTDSFITFSSIEDPKYAHLLKKYVPDYNDRGDWGNPLGAIKNEANDAIKYSKTPEEYGNGSDLYFDRAVVLGCKSYCVERNWINPNSATVYKKPSLFKTAMKGVKVKQGVAGYYTGKHDEEGNPVIALFKDENGNHSPKKFDYEIFSNLNKGTVYIQRQLQFISGFRNMLDIDTLGGVRTVIREKNIEPSYNKGVVGDKEGKSYYDVHPLVLVCPTQKQYYSPDSYDEVYDDTNDVPSVPIRELKTLLEAKYDGDIFEPKYPRHHSNVTKLLIPTFNK